jgi:hypothetical protein
MHTKLTSCSAWYSFPGFRMMRFMTNSLSERRSVTYKGECVCAGEGLGGGRSWARGECVLFNANASGEVHVRVGLPGMKASAAERPHSAPGPSSCTHTKTL